MTDLKTLAEAATPGPWSVVARTNAYFDVEASDQPGYAAKSVCSTSIVRARENAAYIAAASPDAILKLLEERDQWEVDCREEVIMRREAEAERDGYKTRMLRLMTTVLEANKERDRLREVLTDIARGTNNEWVYSIAQKALEEAR